MMRFLLALPVLLLTVATPNSASAQLFRTCDLGSTGLCMGWNVLSATSPVAASEMQAAAQGSITIQVWNASEAGTNGRINSFGFWNIGEDLSLSSVQYVTSGGTTTLSSMGDWMDGPNTGYGISGYSAAVALPNDEGNGFTVNPAPSNTPCVLSGGRGEYGVDCWRTSASQYLEFTFTGNVDFNATTATAGFRAQSTGARGEDSFKCGYGVGMSACGDQLITPEPPGPPQPPVTAVPEPSTYALMGLGLAAIFMVQRRRRVADVVVTTN